MKTDRNCRWTRQRLPLLAGGELGSEDRRKVERHLIGCADCRERRDASAGALAALRGFAKESPSTVDAPSLWPSLARQIRQSRHASPRVSWWEPPLPRSWTFASLAAGLGVVVAASIAQPLADREKPVQAVTTVIKEVSDPVFLTRAKPEVTVPPPLTPRQSALPESPLLRPGGQPEAAIKPIEPPSSILSFDYDLDHGTPMTPGNHDPQRTY